MFLITILTWSVLLILLIVAVKTLISEFTITTYIHKLPGPPSKNIFVGNLYQLYGSPENLYTVVRKWGREYYPIYKNWALNFAAVNLLDPHDFETVLCSTKHNEKAPIYEILHNWLGTGLLTSGGSKWQRRRKLLTPAFHFNILQEFIKVFNEETKQLLKILQKNCQNPYIEITDHINGFTLNTIGETAMGINFDSQNSSVLKYKKVVQQIGEILNYRLIRPWLFNKFLYLFVPNCHKEKRLVKVLHHFTDEVVTKREKDFKPIEFNEDFSYSKRKRLAMLDLLLTIKKDENAIDDEGIREEVDTFMFEGHDTTAAAICFALMLIACHPKVQDRIVEELKEVFNDSSKLEYKTLQNLNYLEMCIKEVLRLYPSVPFIARVLGEDMQTHSGYHLKAGSMVNLHIYDLHHNPDIYPDPEKFDPDRFLPENCQNRHHFAFVPFSAGPRNCIGQKFAILEIKTVLCGIFSEFILEPVDTPSSLIMKSELVLRTKNDIRVRFIPRKNKILNNF